MTTLPQMAIAAMAKPLPATLPPAFGGQRRKAHESSHDAGGSSDKKGSSSNSSSSSDSGSSVGKNKYSGDSDGSNSDDGSRNGPGALQSPRCPPLLADWLSAVGGDDVGANSGSSQDQVFGGDGGLGATDAGRSYLLPLQGGGMPQKASARWLQTAGLLG